MSTRQRSPDDPPRQAPEPARDETAPPEPPKLPKLKGFRVERFIITSRTELIIEDDLSR